MNMSVYLLLRRRKFCVLRHDINYINSWLEIILTNSLIFAGLIRMFQPVICSAFFMWTVVRVKRTFSYFDSSYFNGMFCNLASYVKVISSTVYIYFKKLFLLENNDHSFAQNYMLSSIPIKYLPFIYTIIWFQVFLSNTNYLYTVLWFQVFLSNTNNLYTVLWFQGFLSNTNNLYTVVWFQVFLSNTNNLYTVVWFQVFLSNTNNLYTVVWFQVFLSNTNNLYTVVWFQVFLFNTNIIHCRMVSSILI